MTSSKQTFETDVIVARIRAEVQRRKAELLARALVDSPKQGTDDTPAYRWGDRLEFRASGNGVGFLRDGWAAAEPEHSWSSGRFASVEIPVGPIQGDLLMTMEAWALTAAERPSQRVGLSIDTIPVGEWSVAGKDTYSTVLFFRQILGKRTLALHFDLPNAFSPASVGLNSDTRDLGIALISLVLAPITT